MALQVSRDPRFHRREHVAQSIGVLLVLVVVAAGLLGLVGGTGPLNTVTRSDDQGLVEVRFQRVLHREADHGITVTVDERAVTGDSVDLAVAGSWLDTVDVSGITPEPSEQIRTGGGVVLRLLTEPGSPVIVRIEFRVSQLGALDGWVRVPGGQASFGQFVFP